MKTFSLRTELLLVVVVGLLSLLLLPALIYLVGTKLFGPHASGFAGMYTSTLQGLQQLQPSAWVLALAPPSAVLLIRLVLRMTSVSSAKPSTQKLPTRREPRLGA
ncbi:MAG: hypothetical protein AB7F79_07005 [Steroidobacteraceae bacterium]